MVISTRTVMGGKNPFLGIAYVAVGGICIVLGTLFAVTHLIKPRYVLPRLCYIMAGWTDNIVCVENLETIRICHGTMTSPVQRPQPGSQDQVMMQHDPLIQYRRLCVLSRNNVWRSGGIWNKCSSRGRSLSRISGIYCQ